MATEAQSLRAWLLSSDPKSRRQAHFGQAYRRWLALQRNPLALVGLAIVVGLIVIAALAPWIAP